MTTPTVDRQPPTAGRWWLECVGPSGETTTERLKRLTPLSDRQEWTLDRWPQTANRQPQTASDGA